MEKPIYAWVQHRRIKWAAALAGAEKHGRRKGPGVEHCDRELEEPVRAYSPYPVDPLNLRAAVRAAADAQNAKRRRKSSVAMEILCFLSPKFFASSDPTQRFCPQKVAAFEQAVKAWAEAEFGPAFAAARLDLDETTPHVSIFVVPVSERRTKTGKVKREVSVRDRFGRRKQLADIQTTFANRMKPFGAVRGRPKAETGAVNVYFRDFHRQTARQSEELAAQREALGHREQALHADELSLADRKARLGDQELALEAKEAKHRDERAELERERAAFELKMRGEQEKLARQKVEMANAETALKNEREALERKELETQSKIARDTANLSAQSKQLDTEREMFQAQVMGAQKALNNRTAALAKKEKLFGVAMHLVGSGSIHLKATDRGIIPALKSDAQIQRDTYDELLALARSDRSFREAIHKACLNLSHSSGRATGQRLGSSRGESSEPSPEMYDRISPQFEM